MQNAYKLPWDDIAEHMLMDKKTVCARYYFEKKKKREPGKSSWDGCPEIVITDYCPGCKYEDLCRRFANGKK